jgi:hypothetical protein
MVKIVSATFGDEFGSTNVMDSLSDKVQDGGIDVEVDSSLIPVVDKVSGAKTVKLETFEQQDIKDTVAEMCGDTDQVCQEIKTQELVEAKLKQKETEGKKTTAEIIKGRRLKVTYIDAKGQRREAVIPEGQKFQVDKLGNPPQPTVPLETRLAPYKQILDSWWGILGTALLAFLYVSSIIVTWMTFDRYGSKITAAGMTAIAVFIPYSGFGLAFFGPFLAEYFRVDKLARLKAAVPEEVGAIAKATPGLIPSAPALPKMDAGLIPPAPIKGGLRRILSGRK